jgi:carbon monoxide dehydrogenase subunit G
MQMVNEFTVAAGPDSAFATLSDVERIAPCMPGAVLDEVRGDEYMGRVRVRIGPVGLVLAGTATVLEKDPLARRLVVRGAAKDRRGQGGAEALITMTVEADGRPASTPASVVRVVTELGLSGRVGQLGGAAINQVSGRLISQFVERVDALVAGDQGGVGSVVPQDMRPTQGPAHAWRPPVLRRLQGESPAVMATVVAGVLLGFAVSRLVRSALGSAVRVPQHGFELDR